MQKNAKSVSELDIPHPGILDLENFNKHFELHCYEPCEELKPFVVHIWTQRHRTKRAAQVKPLEVFSGPNTYLFFTKKKSFIRGVSAHFFDYDPQLSSVAAGVKFRPGGFYPFWKQSMSDLQNRTIPIETVFPEVTNDFINTLLKQSDSDIVDTLQKLLLDQHPVYDTKIDAIDHILKIVDKNPLTQTTKDIAQIYGRSERSLQLLFQYYVGTSLKWVIVRRRLLHTIKQVLSSQISWTSAAAESGYSNQSHFTREFKQTVGKLPSEFLKSVHSSSKLLKRKNHKY